MPKLSEQLEQVVQRTGSNTGSLRTDSERSAFSVNVRTDLASIMNQLNTVYKPLVAVLSSEDSLNALDFGLSGNVVFTHITSNAASATAFYDTARTRPRTIKETIDVLLTEIARLEAEISRSVDVDAYDDTELRGLVNKNDLNLQQLKLDTMGEDYSFDNDGQADLTYPLSQHIDALGAFFTGFPGTGNTYSDSYPTISLEVLLSQVVIDTTLDQTVITDLPADLTAIRNFVGMDTVGPETPTYSAHGAISILSDGQSLEEGMQALDAAITGGSTTDLQTAFNNGNTIFVANGTGAGVELTSNDSTADEALYIGQNASKAALRIDSASTVQTEPAIAINMDSVGSRAINITTTSGDMVARVADTRTTGAVLTTPSAVGTFLRNRSAAQTAAPVMVVSQLHASDDQDALTVTQSGSGNAITAIGNVDVTGDVALSGKLTVGGLIDPTGLVTDYLASAPVGALASKGTFWSRNDGTPMWTDENGVDFALSEAVLHASTHIQGGADEVDGDQLDIDYAPTFYTPVTSPPEATDVAQLTAHLAGIDAALGLAGGAGGETLTQTLALGNVTGGRDIEMTSGDMIHGVSATLASNNTGGEVTIAGGDGDGTGNGGDILLIPGAIGGSGTRDGWVGVFTATPAFQVDVDLAGADEGVRLGNVFAGNHPSAATTALIGHKTLQGAAGDSFALLTATGTNYLNFSTGKDLIVTDNATTAVASFSENGIVLGSLGSEPPGETGALYYNTGSGRARIYESGLWTNLRAFTTESNITSNKVGTVATDDFVFGANTLESPASTARFQFDKSKAAFRAGESTGTEWNAVNVGQYSTAFGLDNIATGQGSFIGGGTDNSVSAAGVTSFVGGGVENSITAAAAVIAGGGGVGVGNTVSAARGFIGAGQGNTVSAADGVVGGGDSNVASAANAFVGGGTSNIASGSNSMVAGGSSNQATAANAVALGGQLNVAGGLRSLVGVGDTNVITAGNNTAIVAGASNALGAGGSATGSVIVGGTSNTIAQTNAAERAFIGAGLSNAAEASQSGIVAGETNTIGTDFSAPNSFVGAGISNVIGSTSPASRSAIVAGEGNTVDSPLSFIGGGQENNIQTTGTLNIIVGGGGSAEGNEILGVGATASFIGAGKLNIIDVVTGSITNGELRTEDIPEVGPPPDQIVRNQHAIVGGYSNIILAEAANGGELGFIGGGAYNEINDTNGIFHGHVITGGFNNLIEARRYSFIGTGFENWIHDDGGSTPSYSAILTGNGNQITDGASNSVILGGELNVINDNVDSVTVISSNNQTGRGHGSIFHGPATAASWVAHTVWNGTAPDGTNPGYLLTLDDAGGPITSLGTNKFFPIDAEGVYGFMGEFTGYVFQNSFNNFFLHGRVWASGSWDANTANWVFENQQAEGLNAITTGWLATGNEIQWIYDSGSNTVGLRVNLAANEANGEFTVNATITYRRVFFTR